MSHELSKNILATVIYYDGFEYPLTAFEIWKYMIRSNYCYSANQPLGIKLSDVIEGLNEKSLYQYVEHLNGFYFLKGRKDLVRRRIANNKTSIGKLRRLVLIARWLRLAPFVRMVAVTGAIAMKNSKVASDLDLLIVLKHGKIWTGRTMVTLLLHLLGKRRHGGKITDRACLNHFVTDKSLEVITKDLYSASEYMFIFPIFGWEIFKKFQLRNRWISQMKPSYGVLEIPPFKLVQDSFFSKAVRNMGEILFGGKWIENVLGRVEKDRIEKNPKTHQEGSLVYANDDALVFLPSPHGPLVFEKFKARVNELV